MNVKSQKENLKVTLIGKSNLLMDGYEGDSSDLVFMAMSQCYKNHFGLEELRNTPPETKERIMGKVLGSGHTSVSEHLYYTFLIENISMPVKQQLLRHRIASPTERSLRYTRVTGEDQWFAVPDKVLEDFELFKGALRVVNGCLDFYNLLLERGVKEEDARYFLPYGTTTTLVLTINCRSLKNFFGERLCSRTQKEHRILAEKMREILIQDNPLIFLKNRFAEPKCIQNGYCSEEKPCRKEFRREKD